MREKIVELLKERDLSVEELSVLLDCNSKDFVRLNKEVNQLVSDRLAVFDVIYNPQETVLLKYAKEAGIKYSDGLSMLVWQAAVAQEIWFDTEFTMDDIKKVLKITQEEMEKI